MSFTHHNENSRVQKDCFEVYALVPGLLREEVTYVIGGVPFYSLNEAAF